MSFQLGSISSGTLRSEDLLPALTDELYHHAGSVELVVEADSFIAKGDWTDENAEWIVEDIIEALQEFAPPFVYFGAHSDDPADFGWWVNDESIREELSYSEQDSDGYAYLEDSDVWVCINDHGNITLYENIPAAPGEEIWSI